ncbi:MAG: fibronectin type III domain-containing protein [Betaproteobacteria bacterium]|nr:fibronectin type III domain-containing protein [Betaproteobacteria bacterium]
MHRALARRLFNAVGLPGFCLPFVATLVLLATGASAATVSLAWDPVATPPVSGYTIHWGTASGAYSSQVDAGNSTSRSITGLTDGTTYYFAVTAYDAVGGRSGYSNELIATAPYAAPVADFSSSATSGFAPLSVNFTSTSTGTIATHAWTFGDGTTSSSPNPVKTYSTAGSYTVSLTVTGPGGSSTRTSSNYITVSSGTDTTAPTAPASLAATANGSSSINLTWAAATDNVGVTGYRVERCQGATCTNFAQVATPAGTTHTDSGLAASTAYRYRVRATDAVGNLGPYSAIASATTATSSDTTAPSATANLVATVSGRSAVNLTWSAATDNVGVVQYRVERCQGSTSCTSFAQIGTAPSTSYADTGLTASTIYRYRVRAADAAGNLGAYSNRVAVTTDSASDTTPPSTTAGLVATVGGSTAINLAWTAATDNVGVTGYRVERCQGASCTSFTQIAATAATSYSSTGLTPATTYRYRVRAADAAGNLGAYSAIASATTTVVAPTAAFTATPVSGSAPLTVAFTSSSSGSITSYAWTFGDGTTSTLQNPSKTYTAAGSFTVGLTVTGPGGSHTATRTNMIAVAGSPATLESVGVLVDRSVAAGTVSNGNGILEPGETVLVAPVWEMTAGSTVAVSASAQVSGQGSAAFALPDNAASYGTVSVGATVDCASATGNCYRLSVSDSVRRPALKWGVTFTETLSTGTVVSRTIPIGGSFSDVPTSYLFYPMIEAMVWNDIALGFLDGTYQPAAGVSRWQTAMFLARGTARAIGTSSLPVSGTVKGTPYNCVAGGFSAFADIPPTDSGCTQLHFLAARNVNLSFECGGANLACPNAATTRAAMAVLVAGAIATSGDAGVPSTGTFSDTGTARSYNCSVTGGGHFPDVPSSSAFCRHANYLWARGFIDGFADGTFQPQLGVTRGQMAKFLANALRLTLD